MGETIFEFILLIVLVYPGAFVRWAFAGFKTSYKGYLTKDEDDTNYAYGLALFLSLMAIFISVKKV